MVRIIRSFARMRSSGVRASIASTRVRSTSTCSASAGAGAETVDGRFMRTMVGPGTVAVTPAYVAVTGVLAPHAPQLSTSSPRILPNSLSLPVTSTSRRTSAWAAMSMSSAPMGFPALSSRARSWA